MSRRAYHKAYYAANRDRRRRQRLHSKGRAFIRLWLPELLAELRGA